MLLFYLGFTVDLTIYFSFIRFLEEVKEIFFEMIKKIKLLFITQKWISNYLEKFEFRLEYEIKIYLRFNMKIVLAANL